MNRTWKDAACEVAWNKIRHGRDAIYMPLFLEGINNCVFYDCGDLKVFTAFRAAFMKWLDESEAKR